MTTGEVVLCDGSSRPFESLEQMMRLVAEEFDQVGIEAIKLVGVDDRGENYRMALMYDRFKTGGAHSENSIIIEKTQQRLLGEMLLRAGVVTEEQLQQAIAEQKKTGSKEKIGELLIRMGFCTPGQVLDTLSKQIGI
jgi:precorrin-6B methylase 2